MAELTISWVTPSTTRLPEGGDLRETPFEELALDIVSEDTYDVATLVTEHAIESQSGADVPITDHVSPTSDRASATVYVADMPGTRTPGATRTTVEFAGGNSLSFMLLPAGTTRGSDAFETLRTLARNGTRVDVDGLRRPLTGWVIDTVSSPRTTDMSGVMIATITFREIRIAEIQDVQAPSPRVERGRRQANRGNQNPAATGSTDSVSSAPEDSQSAAASLVDALQNLYAGGSV
jgi:hypothetical protein